MPSRIHECPGGCGRSVGQHLLACRQDWYRLPTHLQRAISEAYARVRRNRADAAAALAHRAVVAEALAWFRENRPVPDG